MGGGDQSFWWGCGSGWALVLLGAKRGHVVLGNARPHQRVRVGGHEAASGSLFWAWAPWIRRTWRAE